MIIDEVNITVEGGKGGNGLASFRHEKFVPFGGPDGGDGGKGGDVIIKASNSVHTLSAYQGKKYFKAENGVPGGTNKKTGHNGKDIILSVPTGTIISQNNKNLIDLTKQDQLIIIAKGGRGGWGNVHFKLATHQTPHEFNLGEPGQKKDIKLELKLIADIGLIGLPNVGKSTLLSVISHATPKIADYPFTTLEPNLGMVRFDDHELIAADIPGLIEGASQGKGLGHKFLKHIERTKILVHILDVLSKNPQKAYQIIRQELSKYSPNLAKKKEIIVLNKIDLLSPNDQKKILMRLIKKFNKPIFPISAVSKSGLKPLLSEIVKMI